MSVVTISLYWGFLPKDIWDTEKDAVYRDGKVKNPNLAFTWHVKLSGVMNRERSKLTNILGYEELEYETESGDDKTIYWLIRRDEYNPRSKCMDDVQAATNDKNDPPVEFITKYLSKLNSLGYTVTSAPSVVTANGTTMWTLSKPKGSN